MQHPFKDQGNRIRNIKVAKNPCNVIYSNDKESEGDKMGKVIEIFGKVPDYRKGNGIRHKLVDILMIGLLTIICNGNDFAAMVEFGRSRKEVLEEFLELPHGIPSEDTFERVFRNLDPLALQVVFEDFLQDLRDNLHVSIDGKIIRGSRCEGKKAKHVVTAFAGEMKLVLGQLATDEKSNEITAIPELLDMFCRKGMVITIDAMGAQSAIAEKIIEKEADYVLSIKGNQQSTLDDISLFMETEVLTQPKNVLSEKGLYESTLDKDHGRIETRECYIWNNTDCLSNAAKWLGIHGIGLILSKRQEIGKEPSFSREYVIFSLKDATAADILRLKRGHWAIENNLHWSLDVTFREDEARARLGNAAENLNILRKQALQLMKKEPSKGSMRMKRFRCSLDISYAFMLAGVK